MAGGPFRRTVVLGDSISYGMCAAEPRHAWAQVAASLLRDFQDEEIVVLNRGLPAGVISPRCPGYGESAKPTLIERYRLVADRFDAVFVDTLRIMGGADWLLHVDSCHLNDLGHVLVGNGVFEAIARHTRSMADTTFRTITERDISILNTGGTDASDEIRSLWADALGRFTSHVDDQAT